MSDQVTPVECVHTPNDAVPPVEEICNNSAAQVMALNHEIDRLRELFHRIVRQHQLVSHCKGCARAVVWVITEKGKNAPYDLNGTSHWATCPRADQFRKKEKQNATASTND